MGEVLEIEIRVSRMGRRPSTSRYRVTGADGRLVAEATTTQVCFDWRARSKVLLTEERRREIEAFEAGPQ